MLVPENWSLLGCEQCIRPQQLCKGHRRTRAEHAPCHLAPSFLGTGAHFVTLRKGKRVFVWENQEEEEEEEERGEGAGGGVSIAEHRR
jgi:hypothetical protein